MMPVHVFIADDHALVREGTRHILEQDPGIEVVGEAADGAEAVAQIARLEPDVALLDIRMGQLNGVEATREIRARTPATAILILSAYDDNDYVMNLLEAGAAGYLLKTVRAAELVDAVHRVHAGETVLHPEIARKVALLWRHGLPAGHSAGELTDREMDVLRLVCRGLRNKEVAQELSVSVRTVEGHLRAIFAHLGVRSRTEAALLAASRGWLGDGPP